MKGSNRVRQRVVILVLAVVALVLSVTPAMAAGGGIAIPPNSSAYGKTLGEWGGQWWIWALGIPADKSPMLDPTGANCNVNQAGPVFYLAGTLTNTQVGKDVIGQAERNCALPAGKAILFPILNTECSVVEGNGSTYADLSACAKGIMNGVGTVQAEFDGAPVAGNPVPATFRAQSPLMTFVLPENNVMTWCGPTSDQVCPAGPSNFVSDGYYIMLTPPAAGLHTLHIHGQVPLSATSTFFLDVTYHLTIGQ